MILIINAKDIIRNKSIKLYLFQKLWLIRIKYNWSIFVSNHRRSHVSHYVISLRHTLGKKNDSGFGQCDMSKAYGKWFLTVKRIWCRARLIGTHREWSGMHRHWTALHQSLCFMLYYSVWCFYGISECVNKWVSYSCVLSLVLFLLLVWFVQLQFVHFCCIVFYFVTNYSLF